MSSSEKDSKEAPVAAGTAAGPAAEEPVRPVLNPAAAKRANASVIGMIMALAVSVLAFLPVVLLNAAPKDQGYRPAVDVATVASHAADVAGFTPAAPKLSEGYSPNYARWNGAGKGGVAFWDVGYLTPQQRFVSIVQSADANPTWLAQTVDQAPLTGSREVGGVEWALYDTSQGERSLVSEIDGTTLVIKGSADFPELDEVAGAALTSLNTPTAAP